MKGFDGTGIWMWKITRVENLTKILGMGGRGRYPFAFGTIVWGAKWPQPKRK